MTLLQAVLEQVVLRRHGRPFSLRALMDSSGNTVGAATVRLHFDEDQGFAILGDEINLPVPAAIVASYEA